MLPHVASSGLSLPRDGGGFARSFLSLARSLAPGYRRLGRSRMFCQPAKPEPEPSAGEARLPSLSRPRSTRSVAVATASSF